MTNTDTNGQTRANIKTDAGRRLVWYLSCHRLFPLAVA